MAGSPEAFHILHETESPRGGKLLAEGRFVHIVCKLLPTDQRAFEVDLDFKPRTGEGAEFTPGTASFDSDRFQNANKASLCFLRDNTRLIESFDKTRRRTIENRNFRTINFNDKVINAQRGDRRHQVLNRVDLGLFSAQATCRGQLRQSVRHGRALPAPCPSDLNAGIRFPYRHRPGKTSPKLELRHERRRPKA